MVDARAAVVLTRAPSDNQPLRHALEHAGHPVLEVPTADFAPVACDLVLPTDIDAVTFASPHGVLAWVSRAPVADLLRAQTRGVRVGVVGPGTAQALADAGVVADVVAQAPATGKQLAHQLIALLAPEARVLLLQAEHSQPDLAQTLTDAGHTPVSRAIYRNVEPPPPSADLLAQAALSRLIYVAAPSAADRLLAWAPQLRDRPFVAIGPTTAAVLHDRHGMSPLAVCTAPDLSTVTQTLLNLLA